MKACKVCKECGGLNKHLRSCSQNEEGNHYSKYTSGEQFVEGLCDTSLDDLNIPGLCDT